MEEAKDKVRARSAAATEMVDGSKELGNQIVRLMATLTRAEQGNCPASALNSPRHRGHGRGLMDRNTPTCPSSHNGQMDLVKQPLLTAPPLQVGGHCSSGKGEHPNTKWYPKWCKIQETPTHYSVSDARAGVTWLGSALLQPRC